MKLIRSVSMHTDHSYHGTPIETSTVTLFANTDVVTPEQMQVLKRQQENKLHSLAKAMPHSYWRNNEY